MNGFRQQVFIVDDNESIRQSMGILLDSVSLPYRTFSSAAEFLDYFDRSKGGCLVLDIRMPGISGLQLQQKLSDAGVPIPIIFITGHADIPMAVEAMRNGAIDFLLKPFREQDLLDRIQYALKSESAIHDAEAKIALLRRRINSLTPRQREVFERVTQGQLNKAIAAELDISERTVEVHRSEVMRKMGAESLADLIKAKVAADRAAPAL